MHIGIVINQLSEPVRERWRKRSIARDIQRRAYNVLRTYDHREVWDDYRRATSPDATSSITYTDNGNHLITLILRVGSEDYNLALDNLVTLDLETLTELNALLSKKDSSKWRIENKPPAMNQQNGVNFDDFLDLAGSNRIPLS